MRMMYMNRNKVSYVDFPKQHFIGAEVLVSFGYDTDHMIPGVIVRNDADSLGTTIIQLDDGRFVLGTECFYEQVNRNFDDNKIQYRLKDIPLDPSSKKRIIGSISGRDHINMDDHLNILLPEGSIITEALFNTMLKQGRKMVTIKEKIKMAELAHSE